MNAITWMSSTPLTPILISSIGIIVGLFIAVKPKLTIEMQKEFYGMINWRMVPISIKKEIRNTKIMGIFLVVVSIGGVICSFLIAVLE